MSASSRRETKTDNRSLALKLDIRRWALRKAGLTELRVLDLCAGEGHIWRALREECKIAAYTPCDRAPRMAGVIKGEAERLVDGFDLARFNVIDVDTYGEPWACWLKIAPRLRSRAVILLTHGTVSGRGGCNTSAAALSACGIPAGWPVPQKAELAKFAAGHALAVGAAQANVEAAAKVELVRVSYYALVCGPR